MTRTFSSFSALLSAALFCSAAHAAGGTSNISTLFQSILDVMQDVGAVLATIAFVYAGFKMFFMGARIDQVAGPLIGGVVVGAASWIAKTLVS